MRFLQPVTAQVAGTIFLAVLLVGSVAAAADSKVIEGAKKEGELGWWSTIAQDQSQKIIEEFMKVYPFIKASYWRSGSVGIHNKVLIEARAGRPSWDVVSQTTPEFIHELKQKAVIAPYNSPERRHFSNDLKDKDGYWTGT
jgi:iron(III) transport system substrate-binding protein